MTVGERIKRQRQRRGMSQQELADKTGYTSRSSIAKIEAGAVQIPQVKIECFAKVLGVGCSYLMGWNDSELDTIINSYELTPYEQDEYDKIKNINSALFFGGKPNENSGELEEMLKKFFIKELIKRRNNN